MSTDISSSYSVIKPLYGIRGIAALWVIAFHYSLYLNVSAGLNLGFMEPIIHRGYFGVEPFFILSGLILAHRYYKQFSTINFRDYCNFLKNRIARIYPAYIFGLFIVFLFFMCGSLTKFVIGFGDYGYKYLFLNAVMMQAWSFLGFTKWSWNFPGWSVSVEWFLYITSPLLFYVSGRVDKKYLMLILFLSASSVLGYFTVTDPNFFNLHGEKYGLIRGASEFIIGYVFFTLIKNQKQSFLYDFLSVLSVILLILFLFLRVNGVFILIPLFALVPLVTLSKGFVTNFLNLKPLAYLGEMSYSLYIMQFPFQLMSNNLFSQKILWLNSYQTFALYLSQIISLIIIASMSYFFIEKPFRKKLRKIVIKDQLNKTEEQSCSITGYS
ncbi:MAG: acyltransferase [Gammaproteobacteria bacterium]|nr:acyltransferase [Gammaproteobacteria bacterium]